MAAINAFKSNFPNATARGCFFHFSQCLWRKIQSPLCHDVHRMYSTDATFALNIKMIPALAFVPPANVVTSFSALLDEEFFKNNDTLLAPLIDYVEDTWVGRQRRNRRMPPTFSIEIWNCHSSVLGDLPKTNNAVEGWHRAFSSLLDAHHPSIWKFIVGLKNDQSLRQLQVEQYLSEIEPPAGRKKYRQSASHLKKIVAKFGQIPIIDYLRSVAHNLSF